MKNFQWAMLPLCLCLAAQPLGLLLAGNGPDFFKSAARLDNYPVRFELAALVRHEPDLASGSALPGVQAPERLALQPDENAKPDDRRIDDSLAEGTTVALAATASATQQTESTIPFGNGAGQIYRTDFRLADISGIDERASANKSVYFGDRLLGDIDIFFAQGRTVQVLQSDITALLQLSSSSNGERLLTLDELRGIGVDLRYDPALDRLILQTG